MFAIANLSRFSMVLDHVEFYIWHSHQSLLPFVFFLNKSARQLHKQLHKEIAHSTAPKSIDPETLTAYRPPVRPCWPFHGGGHSHSKGAHHRPGRASMGRLIHIGVVYWQALMLVRALLQMTDIFSTRRRYLRSGRENARRGYLGEDAQHRGGLRENGQ